jgi:hypothetical protein
MHKMLFAGVALLALAAPGHARSMSYVCNGRRILQTCPMGSQCSVEATVENTTVAYEIYKLPSVRNGLCRQALQERRDLGGPWRLRIPFHPRYGAVMV